MSDFDNRAVVIAEIIRAHQPARLQPSSGTSCECGYWTGNEEPGITRPVGFQGLYWHQAERLLLAFGDRTRDEKD